MGIRQAFTALIVTMALFGYATAQTADANSDSSRWREEYAKLYKEYAKNTNDVSANVALADYYSDAENPMCNYATAMRHISTAEQQYVDMVEKNENHKDINRLIKKKITIVDVRQKKNTITQKSLELLESDKPISDGVLQNYAEAFRNNAEIVRLIEKRRLQNRYEHAVSTNTMSSLYAFRASYPGTLEAEKAASMIATIAAETVSAAQRESEVDSMLAPYIDIPEVQRVATARKSAIAFADIQANPSLQDYKNFMQRYPGSDEYSLALEKIEEADRHEFEKLSTARQYADFAINNPDNPLAETAEDLLKRKIIEEHDMEALKIYMEEFPLDVNYNDIYLEYFKWHTEEGNLSPIALFAKENPDFPFQIALEEALAKAERFDSINVMMPFDEHDFRIWASKVYHLTGKKESYVALLRTLQQFIATKKWPKALERINFFGLSFEDDCIDEVASLRSILEAPVNPKIVFQPVVRPAYDMIHPILHPDGKRLFYNKLTDGVITIQSADRTATGKGIIWKSTGDIPFANTANRDLYIYSLYDDGNKMLVGRDGDIMCAVLENDMWRLEHPFPQPVNSDGNDFDAVMLPDGSGMLLASDRRGGQNLQPSGSYFHGDTALASDIYFVPRNGDSWGKAVNLGINVNSPYMECSPVISSDLKTLYFISDGHGGLGYGDIYYTTRDNADDWRSWSNPLNYGKEANSGHNEKTLSLSSDGKTLYVSSNATGRYGCYSLTPMHIIDGGMKSVTVTTENVGIKIDIIDSETHKTVAHGIELKQGKSWSSSFYTNHTYLLFASCSGTFIPGIVFNPESQTELTPKVYDSRTVLGTTIDLPAVLYESNRSQISPASDTELQHIASFLKAHKSIKAEIGVHTDGDDDTFCFNLSQARGMEIKKRLASLGVENDRIAVSIYGNSAIKDGSHAAGTTILFKL